MKKISYHREEVQTFLNDILIEQKSLNFAGNYDRGDGPAHIIYDSISGIIRESHWMKDGFYINCDNHPSRTVHFLNGTVETENWLDKELRPHRENGPAIIVHLENGTVIDEIWMLHGHELSTEEVDIKRARLRCQKVFEALEIGDLI